MIIIRNRPSSSSSIVRLHRLLNLATISFCFITGSHSFRKSIRENFQWITAWSWFSNGELHCLFKFLKMSHITLLRLVSKSWSSWSMELQTVPHLFIFVSLIGSIVFFLSTISSCFGMDDVLTSQKALSSLKEKIQFTCHKVILKAHRPSWLNDSVPFLSSSQSWQQKPRYQISDFWETPSTAGVKLWIFKFSENKQKVEVGS